MLPSVVRLPPSIPGTGGVEETHVLAKGTGVTLECLVSHGEASPAGFWYDQDRTEWVMLTAGSALLEFEEGTVAMKAGDALTLPAGMRHRVAEVSRDAVWLALHFEA